MNTRRRALISAMVAFMILIVATTAWGENRAIHEQSDEWRSRFHAAIEDGVADSGTLKRSTELAMELLKSTALPDDPVVAADFVLALANRAEVALRRGLPGATVRLMLTHQIAISASRGFLSPHELGIPRRTRNRGQGGGLNDATEIVGGGNPDESRQWRGGRE